MAAILEGTDLLKIPIANNTTAVSNHKKVTVTPVHLNAIKSTKKIRDNAKSIRSPGFVIFPA